MEGVEGFGEYVVAYCGDKIERSDSHSVCDEL
jgi:hypothetical protein